MSAEWKHTAVILQTINLLEIVLHFITEKIRHLNDSVALLRLRRCNHILTTKPLIRLVNPQRACFQIKIISCQRQQFPFSNPAPVQYLKSIIQHRLVHHCLRKFQVFFFCPEEHFLCLLASHISSFRCRIALQTVVSHSMIKNAAKLCMNHPQIVR